MKKFLGWCLMALVAAVISFAASVTLISCDKSGTFIGKAPAIESAQVKLCIDSIVNPVFTTPEDVVKLQNTLASNAYIDSVFISLPEKTLRDVSTVLLKKRPNVTKRDVVNEFISNRQIYENLPPNKDATATTKSESTEIAHLGPVQLTNESKTTVVEAPPTRVGSPGAYKDTIIDGKKALIQTE